MNCIVFKTVHYAFFFFFFVVVFFFFLGGGVLLLFVGCQRSVLGSKSIPDHKETKILMAVTSVWRIG